MKKLMSIVKDFCRLLEKKPPAEACDENLKEVIEGDIYSLSLGSTMMIRYKNEDVDGFIHVEMKFRQPTEEEIERWENHHES